MFVSDPPKLAISDLVRLMKGRLPHNVQQEFPVCEGLNGGDASGGAGNSRRQTETSWKISYFSTRLNSSSILTVPVSSVLVKKWSTLAWARPKTGGATQM